MRLGASQPGTTATAAASTALLLLLAAAGRADAWSWPWSRHGTVHSSPAAPNTRMEGNSILMEWRSKPPAGSKAHHVSIMRTANGDGETQELTDPIEQIAR